jgi:hypothetical protein
MKDVLKEFLQKEDSLLTEISLKALGERNKKSSNMEKKYFTLLIHGCCRSSLLK